MFLHIWGTLEKSAFFFVFFDSHFLQKYPSNKKMSSCYQRYPRPIQYHGKYFHNKTIEIDTKTPAMTCEMILQSKFSSPQKKITMEDALRMLQSIIKNHTVHSTLYMPVIFSFAMWYIHNHYLRQCLREDQIIHFSSENIDSSPPQPRIVYGDTDCAILAMVTQLNLQREPVTDYEFSKNHQFQRERAHALKMTSLLMFGMFH